MCESTKAVTKQEALRYEMFRRQQIIEEKVYGHTPKKFWDDAEERWLVEMKYKRSIRADAQKLEVLAKYLSGIALDEVTPRKLEGFLLDYHKKNVKPATINRFLALIKSILNKAHKEWEWLDRVPYFKLQKENNQRTRWLLPQEASQLIKELPEYLKVPVMFTLLTGLRQGELCKAKWEHIINGRLYIPTPNSKNKEADSIPLSQACLDILDKLPRTSKYIFTLPNGLRLKEPGKRTWHKVLKRVGIQDFRWHDLRHTWASWKIQNGTPLIDLQRLGRWKSHTMVLRYAHFSPHQLVNNEDNLQQIGAELGQALISKMEPTTQLIDSIDGPCRDRTYDPLIKSLPHPDHDNNIIKEIDKEVV